MHHETTFHMMGAAKIDNDEKEMYYAHHYKFNTTRYRMKRSQEHVSPNQVGI